MLRILALFNFCFTLGAVSINSLVSDSIFSGPILLFRSFVFLPRTPVRESESNQVRARGMNNPNVPAHFGCAHIDKRLRH
jgi:hypothetical protein